MRNDEKNTALGVAYEEYRPFDPLEPERNLLRAILLSALNDVKKDGLAGEEAKLFFLDHDENYVFSFQAICQFLELDPDGILTVAGIK